MGYPTPDGARCRDIDMAYPDGPIAGMRVTLMCGEQQWKMEAIVFGATYRKHAMGYQVRQREEKERAIDCTSMHCSGCAWRASERDAPWQRERALCARRHHSPLASLAFSPLRPTHQCRRCELLKNVLYVTRE